MYGTCRKQQEEGKGLIKYTYLEELIVFLQSIGQTKKYRLKQFASRQSKKFLDACQESCRSAPSTFLASLAV